MKTLILIMSVMALGLMGVGCSKSNSQANNNTNTAAVVPGPVIIDPIPGGGNSGGPVFSGGSTATFTPVSLAVMNEYVALHPLNNPTNFKININLAQSSAGRYGGTITLSYIDNGIQYDGVFNAGMGTNPSLNGMYDNGKSEAEYNYWFNFENQIVFTGFFQDAFGSITLSLTPESSTTGGGNDGEPISTGNYKGTVSFKNFCVKDSNGRCLELQSTTFAQQSPYRSCWFIYTGPFDCRSNVIQTKCGLAPGVEAGYKVLGTFSGINIKTAFNISN